MKSVLGSIHNRILFRIYSSQLETWQLFVKNAQILEKSTLKAAEEISRKREKQEENKRKKLQRLGLVLKKLLY